MPELKIKKPNRIAVWMNDFKGKSRADKRRAITDLLFKTPWTSSS